MNKPGILGLAVIGLLSLTLTASSSWAQSGRRIHYSTLYNTGTVETVRGEVINLGKALSGNGRDYCLNLTMRSAQEKILVILEPASYAKKLPIGIKPGDQVEVRGSRVTIMEPTMIAAEIKKGDTVVKLRDVNGRPAWAVGEDWHIH
ncbi:MAG: exodeoxyribonuclease VII large subunit [Syntrophobacterales bacterium]|nr:exodeoxyribonuclease VII large subunit [Syntrophobacterales bacterium]